MYTVNHTFSYVVYGFDLSNTPQNLFVRTGETPTYENGIGFVSDPDDEINTQHYVQVDLGDWQRVRNLECADPRIRIGSIQVGEGYTIYGSNSLGQRGVVLSTYTNTVDNSDANASREVVIPSYGTTDRTATGDLYRFGAVPYRYISVSAVSKNVTLNMLIFTMKSRGGCGSGSGLVSGVTSGVTSGVGL